MNSSGVTALSIEFSAREVKLGVVPPTSLYHINDFDHYTAQQKNNFSFVPGMLE